MAERPRRFYKVASAALADGGGFAVLLDGRPVRTPANAPLVLPNAALANALAGEWAAQGAQIDPSSMPLTQLASTAIDRVLPDPSPVVLELARYVQTDMLCYRTDDSPALAATQRARWQPLLDWASDVHGISLVVTPGIMPVAQTAEAFSRAGAALAACGSWRLAGLSLAVPALGSLVLGLALADGRIDADTAYDLSLLEETHQAEAWGEDPSAAQRRDGLRRDITTASTFLASAGPLKTVRAIVAGRVQGVWYRAWTAEQAASRGLRGWVRNRRDGTVEALFAGPVDAVDGMLAACGEGPPLAKVTAVDTCPTDDTPPVGFEKRSSV